MSTTSCDDCRRSTSMHCWRHPIIVGIAALPAPPAEGVPRTPSDPSGCPICGDWRDYPTADCANCGWAIRPCGDALGLCVYAGPHEGPHKIAGSWKQRIEAEAAQPAPGLDALRTALELHHIESAAKAVLLPSFGHICDGSCAERILARLRGGERG